MLYALTAVDVMRLRQLLAAYERGRLRQNTRQQFGTLDHQNDYQLLNVGSSIVSGALGTGLIVSLDDSATPVQTTQSGLPTLPVYNPLGFTLAAGVYLCAREPSQGYYVPMPCCNSGTSGSGSGSGSGIVGTIGCYGSCLLPATLYVTISGVTANCSCSGFGPMAFDGTYACDYLSGQLNPTWIKNGIPFSGIPCTLNINIQCTGTPANDPNSVTLTANDTLTGESWDFGNGFTAWTTATCGFWQGTMANPHLACTGGSATFTISE